MSVTRVDLQREQLAHAETKARLVEVEAKLRAALSDATAKAEALTADLAKARGDLSEALSEAKTQAKRADDLAGKLERAKAKALSDAKAQEKRADDLAGKLEKAKERAKASAKPDKAEKPAPQIIRAKTLEAEAEIAELRAKNSILERALAEAMK